MVGLLMWIARHAHPEVMQPAMYLVQFCTGLTRDHFLAVLCVLKYLNTVKDRKKTHLGVVFAIVLCLTILA